MLHMVLKIACLNLVNCAIGTWKVFLFFGREGAYVLKIRLPTGLESILVKSSWFQYEKL